jgi:predicted component of type VI protein secretion system
MPLATTIVDSETHLVPPSEIVLTLRAAQELGSAGLIPLLSLRGSDAVRSGIFQSIAEPPSPLAGRWPDPRT